MCSIISVPMACPSGTALDRQRRGYTLLEVTIVFALLVAFVAVFWPAVAAIREGERLPRVADNLRGVLVGLRIRAMEEGSAYEFGFRPNTGYFQIGKVGSVTEELPESEPSGSDSGPRIFGTETLLGGHYLEKGLVFVPKDEELAATGSTDEDYVTIRFEPDGTATAIEFELVDEANVAIKFRIRRLTGAVTASRPTGIAESVPGR